MNIYQNKFEFINKHRYLIILSALLFILSIFLFFFKGLNLGIDFKGGTVIEMQFDKQIKSEQIRKELLKLNLGDVKVKEFGKANNHLAIIEKKGTENNFISNIKSHLNNNLNSSADFRRVEIVGPKISQELTEKGLIAVSLALICMLIYIWFRFEWQFSVGAIFTLTHDVFITIGVFSLLGYEFNLSIVAAVLTIIGYSMNDTVVIYDRIRENLKKFDKKDLSILLNDSINETLPRTIKTSVTTLLALISIYFFGGEILKGFSFALIWGVIIGTYSSIFIASPILLYINLKRDWIEKIDNTP